MNVMTKENSKSHESKAEDLILVLVTKDQIYLNMVKDALDGIDIPSLIKSPMGHYLRGMLPIDLGFFNMRLYVQKEHENKAAEIVSTIVPPEEIL